MFNKITAEQAGISSDLIKKVISRLEKKGYNFHDVILMRGEDIFFESYWAPFNKDFYHRQYSITKSYMSVAVGVLVGEGKVDLDAPIVKYFPEYDNEKTNERIRRQTVRNMLTMTTAACPKYWFNTKPADRVEHYFYESSSNRLCGSWNDYDSDGSFILGAMVERISGKTLLQFMKEHFLDELGFGEGTKTLICPGGHTWSDSSLICLPRDMAKFVRFVAAKGEWNGKQLVDRQYMIDAVKSHSDPQLDDCVAQYTGYGYQIWRPNEDEGCFSFNGMGGQFGIYVPKKDLTVVVNSDNQVGNPGVYHTRLFDAIFDEIVDNMADGAIAENPAAAKELDEYAATRVLRTAFGKASDPMEEKILNKTFRLDNNAMGIKWIRFTKEGEDYSFNYENEQGVKEIKFGMLRNVFGRFPQEGYSDVCGTKPGKEGNLYKCCASGAWNVDNKLDVFVQVIDEYFGRLSMVFCFPTEDSVALHFTKHAEDFMREYNGTAVGYAE